MYKYGYWHCMEYRNKIIEQCTSAQEHIWKNFMQMDFDNADAHAMYEEIVKEMIRELENEKNQMYDYRFQSYTGYE